jgi:hypothetical protein
MAKWEIGGGAGAEGICKKEPRARGKGRGRASVSRGRQFRDFRLMWIYLASRGAGVEGEWWWMTVVQAQLLAVRRLGRASV